jgi:hypothetical protein
MGDPRGGHEAREVDVVVSEVENHRARRRGRRRFDAEFLRRPRKVYLTDAEVAAITSGPVSEFSAWARSRLLGPPLNDLQEPAPPQPPPEEIAPQRESLTLPPPGEADADGCRYRWDPRPKGDAGTLTVTMPDGRALQMDLVGVSVEERERGVRVLSFADRTMVRDLEKP